ncbi:MAG TPA: DUF3750 domain-containing protein [Stellaceae bacterium]|nr:DUF3750 domain-containing protein [Stellaceae bacterium]
MSAIVLVLLLPVIVSACMLSRDGSIPWYKASREPTGMAPDPATTREAVIQVYAARAVAWRGVVAVHTWFAVKPTGAPKYTRYEVVGFGVAEGAPSVRVDRTGPDNYWFGDKPQLLLDRRGAGVDALIDKVRAAIAAYPYPHEYRAWPGPNSNTFTAYVARAVPELHLALPSIAIGKDYLPDGALIAEAPSGTGWQLSLWGVVGILAARAEGIELNLLGLNLGVDVARPALLLPGIGRVGMAREPTA